MLERKNKGQKNAKTQKERLRLTLVALSLRGAGLRKKAHGLGAGSGPVMPGGEPDVLQVVARVSSDAWWGSAFMAAVCILCTA